MSDDNMTQRSYFAEITSIARECLREQHEDSREVSEAVHENVDGHRWIIYNRYHVDILTHSSNQDAYFDSYGKLEADDYSTAMQQMAFAAMEADVQAAVHEEEAKMVRTYTVTFTEIEWAVTAEQFCALPISVTVGGPEANNDIDSEDAATDAAVDILQERHGHDIETYEASVTLKVTFEND